MKQIRSYPFVILSILLVLQQGCKKDDDTTGTDTEITGKVWTLEYLENTGSHFQVFFPDIPEKITIEFKADNQLLFNGICNTGTGDYAIENEKLTITSLVITQIYCDNSDWETVTASNLLQASTAEMRKGKLIISSNGDFNLIFK